MCFLRGGEGAEFEVMTLTMMMIQINKYKLI